MEIISIEAGTFEEMMKRLEYTCRLMDNICERQKEKTMGDWMDNQDVCLLLGISPRTLQTLRDNGTLAYSKISHKIYYRPEDVQQLIPAFKQQSKL